MYSKESSVSASSSVNTSSSSAKPPVSEKASAKEGTYELPKSPPPKKDSGTSSLTSDNEESTNYESEKNYEDENIGEKDSLRPSSNLLVRENASLTHLYESTDILPVPENFTQSRKSGNTLQVLSEHYYVKREEPTKIRLSQAYSHYQDADATIPVTGDRRELYFRNSRKPIDYVLAWVDDDEDWIANKAIREVFEYNLAETGLQFEVEPKEYSSNKKTVFVKLHVPWDLCLIYAERMKMKMPLKDTNKIPSQKSKFFRSKSVFTTPYADKKFFGKGFQTAEFALNKIDYFDFRGDETFFSSSKRSRIAYRILSECYFGDTKQDIGIEKLLAKGVYSAAYPLHDHTLKGTKRLEECDDNPRKILYLTWARWTNWYKPQPFHAIRHYFGEKMGLYFAWLGFYTSALVVPSIVGFLCFIFGLLNHDQHLPVKEICDPSLPTYAGNLTMCPLCDEVCHYWKLRTSCQASKVTRVIDNEWTMFFTIFMLIWTTLFLKLWKREQYRLSYQWDLVEYDKETALIRPEYEARVKTEKLNPVTQELEPHMPTLDWFTRTSISVVTVVFWICVVCAAVTSVTLFRLTLHAFFSQNLNVDNVVSPSLTTTLCASTVSVLIIVILNKLYEKVAVILTYFELPRTQLEFDGSFTVKMFCFQFVNYYSYLFYIAFFKNGVAYHPGDYFYVFGKWRAEECDSGGCMYELSLQLFIIMFAKQVWNNVLEILVPWATTHYKYWKAKKDKEVLRNYKRWDQDYDLLKFEQLEFFYEYLEIVIQYGFVTLFVVAFPLAPLLALLNNIIEIRLDAYKRVCSYRRPVSQNASTIGAWHFLLDVLSTIAVVTNSFALATTSTTIPQLLYFFFISKENFNERTYEGYTIDSLSIFNVSDFSNLSRPMQSDPFGTGVVKECRYRDYRNPPWVAPKYHVTSHYWQLQATRLGLIIVIEHFVFLLKNAFEYFISDEPKAIRDQVKRDQILVQSVLLKSQKDQYDQDVQKYHQRHTKSDQQSYAPNHASPSSMQPAAYSDYPQSLTPPVIVPVPVPPPFLQPAMPIYPQAAYSRIVPTALQPPDPIGFARSITSPPPGFGIYMG